MSDYLELVPRVSPRNIPDRPAHNALELLIARYFRRNNGLGLWLHDIELMRFFKVRTLAGQGINKCDDDMDKISYVKGGGCLFYPRLIAYKTYYEPDRDCNGAEHMRMPYYYMNVSFPHSAVASFIADSTKRLRALKLAAMKESFRLRGLQMPIDELRTSLNMIRQEYSEQAMAKRICGILVDRYSEKRDREGLKMYYLVYKIWMMDSNNVDVIWSLEADIPDPKSEAWKELAEVNLKFHFQLIDPVGYRKNQPCGMAAWMVRLLQADCHATVGPGDEGILNPNLEFDGVYNAYRMAAHFIDNGWMGVDDTPLVPQLPFPEAEEIVWNSPQNPFGYILWKSRLNEEVQNEVQPAPMNIQTTVPCDRDAVVEVLPLIEEDDEQHDEDGNEPSDDDDDDGNEPEQLPVVENTAAALHRIIDPTAGCSREMHGPPNILADGGSIVPVVLSPPNNAACIPPEHNCQGLCAGCANQEAQIGQWVAPQRVRVPGPYDGPSTRTRSCTNAPNLKQQRAEREAESRARREANALERRQKREAMTRQARERQEAQIHARLQRAETLEANARDAANHEASDDNQLPIQTLRDAERELIHERFRAAEIEALNATLAPRKVRRASGRKFDLRRF